MEYVLIALVLVLLIGGFVTFLALNATRKGGPAATGDDDVPGIGTDPTPLGDTSEHAGEQTEEGATRGDPEAGAPADDDPDRAAHIGRPGEGEGAERLGFEGERPRSERLADREP